ncbi:MAG: DUF3892 domain-containing protein [Pseudomonadota bacterium]|nr:DUF3892 domain-containing protein [Pseudomonadota bacterium]
MANLGSIKGNADGEHGENDSYTIRGRGEVSRDKLVDEVKSGQHPDYHIYERGGEEYVRSNPNGRNKDNVD